jgi:hypothetical protein
MTAAHAHGRRILMARFMPKAAAGYLKGTLIVPGRRR